MPAGVRVSGGLSRFLCQQKWDCPLPRHNCFAEHKIPYRPVSGAGAPGGGNPPPGLPLLPPSVQAPADAQTAQGHSGPAARRVPTLARGHGLRPVSIPAAQASRLAYEPAVAEKMFTGGLTRDFGSVRQGTQLLHRFPVANVYSEPVTIAYLQPSCGCITASAAKRSLRPGERSTIDVRLDAGQFTGETTQNVRVKITGPNFDSTCKLVVSVVSKADPARAKQKADSDPLAPKPDDNLAAHRNVTP